MRSLEAMAPGGVAREHARGRVDRVMEQCTSHGAGDVFSSRGRETERRIARSWRFPENEPFPKDGMTESKSLG